MRHDDGTDVVAGEIVVGCTFEPTHADIDDLAACLAAAHDHTCFWPPLGLLTIREDRHDPWRKIARAAFDHRGYLPSIEAARREGLTIYDICRDERRPATQADIDGIERRVTILDHGRAEVFASLPNRRSPTRTRTKQRTPVPSVAFGLRAPRSLCRIARRKVLAPTTRSATSAAIAGGSADDRRIVRIDIRGRPAALRYGLHAVGGLPAGHRGPE